MRIFSIVVSLATTERGRFLCAGMGRTSVRGSCGRTIRSVSRLFDLHGEGAVDAFVKGCLDTLAQGIVHKGKGGRFDKMGVQTSRTCTMALSLT